MNLLLRVYKVPVKRKKLEPTDCLMTDLYRISLMYHGTDLLDPEVKKLHDISSTALIYLDTDKIYQSLGCKHAYFNGVLCSSIKHGNDVYAVSVKITPILKAI